MSVVAKAVCSFEIIRVYRGSCQEVGKNWEAIQSDVDDDEDRCSTASSGHK